jgi:hypothetical protein
VTFCSQFGGSAFGRSAFHGDSNAKRRIALALWMENPYPNDASSGLVRTHYDHRQSVQLLRCHK